jgi:hypothetical protein
MIGGVFSAYRAETGGTLVSCELRAEPNSEKLRRE